MKPLLVADLFCGAGGSSTGAKQAIAALGRDMKLVCVNHWDRAIETHRRMHPTARHYCQDVASVRPIEAVPEGYLDLLMASPTCTHHSRARGGKPTSDQQRMDPWHIITWLTELRVKRGIIENVPEYIDWSPVDLRTGRPIRSRKGEYFRAWVSSIEALGNRFEWRIIVCADHGDATTRMRFFGQFRSIRGPIIWPMASHSRTGAPDLFGTGARRWRSARECIDWNIKGRSIFDRPKPLSTKTIARIYAGAVKFRWPEPYLARLRAYMKARGMVVPEVGDTVVGLAPPPPMLTVLRRNMDARSLDDPAPTVICGGHLALTQPVVTPSFVLSQASGGAPRHVAEPMPGPTCGGNGGAHALVTPYYSSGSGTTCKSDAEPLDTITTKARFGLAMPVTHAGGGNRARDINVDPLPTLTTAKRGELALVTGTFGERPGQAPRARSVDQPCHTILGSNTAALTEAVDDGHQVDILFRMFTTRELARAMSFSDDDFEYEFAGNKTEVTKQIGNAIPVRTARALVAAAFHDLAPAADAPLRVAAE